MARIHHESFLFMYPTPTVTYSVMPRKTRLWILAPWASKEQPESPRAHAGRRSKGVFSSRVVAGGPMRWSNPLRWVLMGSLWSLLPRAPLPTSHCTLIMGCNNAQLKPLENLMPLCHCCSSEWKSWYRQDPGIAHDLFCGTPRVVPALPWSKIPQTSKKQQQCSAPTGYHSAYGQGTKLSNCLCLMILISLHFYLTRTILLPLFHFIWGLIRVAMQHKSLIHKNYEGHWQRPREDGKHSLLKLKRQIWTKYLGFVKLHFTK